jgi:hypothetical protein
MKVGPTLQQPAAGLAPQVVHVEVHLRELLAAAQHEPAIRPPVRPVADGAEPECRPRLLIILQALAEFVAEHVRVGFELLAVRIVRRGAVV